MVALSACSSHQIKYDVAAAPEVLTSLKRYSREFVLVPGDKLEVVVYRNPDVSRTVVIRADGNITLPLLDDVKASGISIQDLDTIITEKLKTRLRDPEVSIILANPMDPMVYVYGEVGAVKPVPLRQARTLAQAIAYVGGVTRDAALQDIILVRLDTDNYLKMHILKDKADGPAGPYVAYQNTALQADDLIIVPESRRSLTGRFITDFIVKPLTGVNHIITPYFQYKIIQDIL